MRIPLLLTALALPLQAIEFEAAREVTEFSSYYRQILPADLDGDGKLDLVAAGFSSVGWYRHNEQGRFILADHKDYIAEASGVELADFNGDGLPDLLTRSREVDEDFNPLTLKIHLSSGGSGFGGGVVTLPSLGDRYLVRDLDDNGLADLVGDAHTILNPGGPNPQTVNRTAVSIGGMDPILRDVNGDGLLDLISNIGLYSQNLGGGNLSPLQVLQVPEIAGKRLSGLDFIRDERLPRGRALVALMTAEGDASEAEFVLHTEDVGGNWFAVERVKVKPQSWQAVAGWRAARTAQGPGEVIGQLAMLSPLGDGAAAMRTISLSLRFRGNTPSLVVKTLADTGEEATNAHLYQDVTGDGHRDLLIAGEMLYAPEGSFLQMHRGTAKGGVKRKAEIIAAPGHGDVVRKLADLDGDGDLDLVVQGTTTNQRQGQIAWWENRGQGAGFIRRELMTMSGVMEVVAAEDLNDDGRAEVIATLHPEKDGLGKQILISESTRGGKRVLRTIRGSERNIDYPKQVELGDWDGDSIDDLLLWDYVTVGGDPFEPRVRWMKGLPGLRFAKPVVLGESGDERLYDVDADGDLDLAGYAEYDYDGPGSWQEHTSAGLVAREFPTFPLVSEPFSPALADLDGDGRLDFVAGLVPVLAKPAGVFQPLPAFPAFPADKRGEFVRSWFGDLDEDGDADGVIWSAGPGTHLVVAENQGGGAFAAPVPLRSLEAQSFDKVDVLAGDIDGDGKTDLVISSTGQRSRIEWLKGK